MKKSERIMEEIHKLSHKVDSLANPPPQETKLKCPGCKETTTFPESIKAKFCPDCGENYDEGD